MNFSTFFDSVKIFIENYCDDMMISHEKRLTLKFLFPFLLWVSIFIEISNFLTKQIFDYHHDTFEKFYENFLGFSLDSWREISSNFMVKYYKFLCKKIFFSFFPIILSLTSTKFSSFPSSFLNKIFYRFLLLIFEKKNKRKNEV